MNKDHFEHLKEVNRTFYDQSKIADQKAAYMFTFMLALLIWSSEVRKVFTPERYVGAPIIVEVLSVIVALALLVCVAAVIAVLIPRHRSGGTSLFWGAWDGASARLKAAAEAEDTAMLAEEYRVNISHLAAICRSKYRAAAIAFRALAVAIVGHILLLMIA
jgi:hypothetical protein